MMLPTDTSFGIGFRRAGGTILALIVVLSLTAAACTSDNAGEKHEGSASKQVVLVTYESFALPEEAAAEFHRRTGATIKVIKSGDASAMLTKGLLSAGSPEGDVIFGVDNFLATRALSGDLLDSVKVPAAARISSDFKLGAGADDRLIPIDHGEVCMNIDPSWFTQKGIAPPSTLEDLAAPEYKGLTVISSPVTSTPGIAFLVGTVEVFGDDGWQDYWKALRANDVMVRPSWSDAYYTDYTVSGGDRPVVLSYASSPPAEVVFSEGKRTEPVSQVMTSSCVAQIEYAGLLKGAKNPELGAELIRFMIDSDWQRDLPLSNFVYPVTDVELPEEFVKWAPPVKSPLRVPAETVDSMRDEWIEGWRQVME
ncbi:MAG: thiamine ABC transporter substrate-binding protein [Microthrixaceae bacterium]